MQPTNDTFIIPDWPVPPRIRACVTTRIGGCSQPPFASMNLGDHVEDNPADVRTNRETLQQLAGLPASPHWLQQVHGTDVIELTSGADHRSVPQADASFTRQTNVVCAVLTADCLPVLLCDPDTGQVAAAHAGWRGLAAGVLEAVVATFDRPSELYVWLGPAIGPLAFEVGDDVRQAFVANDKAAAQAFVDPKIVPGSVADNERDEKHWLANLYLLARQRLQQQGIKQIYGGDYCTFTGRERFYSYRRDGKTGRMASLVWMES